MKFKGSKKIVSLFLAVLMVVSSVPAFAINASAAVDSTDVSVLGKAIDAYEQKMQDLQNGDIMTNMKAAYDAYVDAQKAIDAIQYGYSTSIDAALVANNLTNATNAMTKWTAPTFTASAYHMNNEATGAYKNVVYGPSGDTWWTPNNSYNFGDTGNLFGVKVALSNNVVTCYDGTDTYIPILLQCYSQKTLSVPGTRQIYNSIFSLANSNVNYTASLHHNWRYVSKVTGDIWNSPESDQNLSYTSANTAKDITKGKDCSAYNRVFLTSNNNNTYYDTIDYSNFVTTSTFYAKWSFGIESATPSVAQTGGGTAYIINYKPLKDRISTLSTELSKYNVANYTQGGLESLLSAIDACTAVNPNSYDYASNVANAVKDCGDAIKAAMGKTYSVTADLDKSAYNAAVAEAEAAIKNTAKYTEESRNELKSVLDNNKSENAKSQPELNNMTSAIITAFNALVLNEYTINLYTVIDDVLPDTPTESIKHKYGDEFTFDSKLSNDYTVQKWVRNVNGSDEKVGSSVTSLTGITYADATYYVYAVKAKKDTKENNVVVSLKDRNNRVVDNMYVELKDGTAHLDVSVDVNNKCVTVNGTELNAIDLTFYKIVGFKINGVEYKENKNISLDITGDLTIETLYDIPNNYTITTDGSCSADKSSACWDEKVTVTAKNGTANTKWYVNDKPVAYGPTYTFRVSGNANIRCENDDKAPTAVATVVSLSYNNPIEKTITVVGSFNVPEDCKVVEKGVLMKTSSVNSPEAVGKIENYTGKDANARKFIAKNYVKDTNQYVINVYSSRSYTDLCVGAVAYVTYTDASGQQQTAYSDLVVFNQNNA